jgi:hypothetical protein
MTAGDEESKHSGRARIIIDSPLDNEVFIQSARNGASFGDENDDYYNEEDDEDEENIETMERPNMFQNSMPLSRNLLNWVA